MALYFRKKEFFITDAVRTSNPMSDILIENFHYKYNIPIIFSHEPPRRIEAPLLQHRTKHKIDVQTHTKKNTGGIHEIRHGHVQFNRKKHSFKFGTIV
jgi:hypothetical protein